jgi:hypothetical protein
MLRRSCGVEEQWLGRANKEVYTAIEEQEGTNDNHATTMRRVFIETLQAHRPPGQGAEAFVYGRSPHFLGRSLFVSPRW